MLAESIFIILLLIGVNALFVAAEFASVSIRRTAVDQLVLKGDKQAIELKKILDDPAKLDNLIASCQVAITLSSLVLGAYADENLSPHIARFIAATTGADLSTLTITSFATLGCLTTLQIIFGELVPKGMALQKTERIALSCLPPVRFAAMILKPFVFFLNGSAMAVLHLLGLSHSAHQHVHSAREIKYILSEGVESGLIKEIEQERLEKALDLYSTTVSELMTPRPLLFAIKKDLSAAQAIEIASHCPYTRILVMENNIDDIVGYLHVKQLLAACAMASAEETQLDFDSLVRKIMIVPPNLTIDKLLEQFKAYKRQIALITDEFGGTRGVISMDDVMSALFGEVADEFQKPMGAEPQADGSIRFMGYTKLTRVEELLDIEIESERNTISGLIVDHLGHVPEAGSVLVIGEMSIEIEQADHRTVLAARVQKISMSTKGQGDAS